MKAYGVEICFTFGCEKTAQRDLYFVKDDAIKALRSACHDYELKNDSLQFQETKPNVWCIIRTNEHTGEELPIISIYLVEYTLHSDDNLTSNIDDIGDLFTMEDFIKNCKSGGFIDSDGFGHYASKTKINYLEDVYPSMVFDETIDTQYTHIMWYNK